MINTLKMELKKALFSKYFIIGLSIMLLFAVLSGVYMIESRVGYNPDSIYEYCYSDGKFTENPDTAIFGFYNSWVGGEDLSLAYTLFFQLLPLGAALPFAWSFCRERKTGYIKNITSRVKKEYYYCSKAIAVFISGMLVVLIPVLVNILMVSAFVPVVKPFVIYTHYNHLYFGNMWADIYYTNPMLYTALYVMLESLYGGIFALLSFAITFYINNIFAVEILPFILMIASGYLQSFIYNLINNPTVQLEFVPTTFIHSKNMGGQVVSWVVITVTLVLLAFSLTTIFVRGKKDEVF